MAQLKELKRDLEERGGDPEMPELLEDALVIADQYLPMLQNKQLREVGRAMGKSMERVERCVVLIRTLDPKPGCATTSPTAPDRARRGFCEAGDECIVVMNDDDLPTASPESGLQEAAGQATETTGIRETTSKNASRVQSS